MGKKKKGEARSKEDDGTDIPSSNTRSGYGSAVNPYVVHVDRPAVDDVQHELDMKHELEQQPLERDRLRLHMKLGSLSVRQKDRYDDLRANYAIAARIAAPEYYSAAQTPVGNSCKNTVERKILGPRGGA